MEIGRVELLLFELPCFEFITKTCPCNMQQFIKAVKNDNLQMKNCDIFHIFA